MTAALVFGVKTGRTPREDSVPNPLGAPIPGSLLFGGERRLAADFAAPLAYYPEPGLLLGLMAMMRPQNYEQRAGLYVLEP